MFALANCHPQVRFVVGLILLVSSLLAIISFAASEPIRWLWAMEACGAFGYAVGIYVGSFAPRVEKPAA